MASPKYAPLTHHLRTIASDEFEMTFAEVESVLGRRLPPSASGDFARHWWANTTTHSQGHGWLDAGWRVERVDAVSKRVRFRKETRPGLMESPPSPFLFDAPLTGLNGAARRMLQDYAEEKGVSEQQAIISILNDTALERRRQMLEWFKGRSRPQTTDSVDLIREDRDSR